jgi:hypothetical protein
MTQLYPRLWVLFSSPPTTRMATVKPTQLDPVDRASPYFQEQVLHEDGERIQSPKRCALKNKQNYDLDKDKKMDNVQNIIFLLMYHRHKPLDPICLQRTYPPSHIVHQKKPHDLASNRRWAAAVGSWRLVARAVAQGRDK